jgi:VanZ family protein
LVKRGALFARPLLCFIIAEIFPLKKIPALIPAAAWLAICTLLLTLPGSKLPKENWLDKIGADKIVHVILFAALTYLWCTVFRMQGRKTLFFISFLLLLYGIGIEFIQKHHIPNRGFDVWDIVADAGGVLLGLYLFIKYLKK